MTDPKDAGKETTERSFLVDSPGVFVVLSGPSGTGKNAVLTKLLELAPDVKYSISVTTRAPRPHEHYGIDYFFVSDEEFQKMIENDQLLEWAEFCGSCYGTPKQFVLDAIRDGYTIISDIEIQGASQIKRKLPDSVLVFLLPPTFEELRRRIQKRGAEKEEAIRKRLAKAIEELKAMSEYDYVIINDDITNAARKLYCILEAERSRVSRVRYRIPTLD